MHEMNDVRQPEREILSRFRKNPASRSVVSSQRLAEVSRFCAMLPADELRQHTGWFSGDKPTNALVHGPTSTARFDNGAVTIQSHMTDFRLARFRAVINRTIHDQTSADAAPQRDVEDGIECHTRSLGGLTECRYI